MFQRTYQEDLRVRPGGGDGRSRGDAIESANEHLSGRAFEILVFSLPKVAIAVPTFPPQGCIIKNQSKIFSSHRPSRLSFYFPLPLYLRYPSPSYPAPPQQPLPRSPSSHCLRLPDPSVLSSAGPPSAGPCPVPAVWKVGL